MRNNLRLLDCKVKSLLVVDVALKTERPWFISCMLVPAATCRDNELRIPTICGLELNLVFVFYYFNTNTKPIKYFPFVIAFKNRTPEFNISIPQEAVGMNSQKTYISSDKSLFSFLHRPIPRTV